MHSIVRQKPSQRPDSSRSQLPPPRPLWIYNLYPLPLMLGVKHILMECVDFHDLRNHFVASAIKDLFENVEPHSITDFIKETRFINNFNVLILIFVA